MPDRKDEIDDETWLALLRGKPITSEQNTDSEQMKLLRATIADWYRDEIEPDEKPDQAALERLLFRLRAEGLLKASSRPSWKKPPRWLAMAASLAVVAIGISLVIHYQRPTEQFPSEGTVMRGVEAAQSVKAQDPEQVLKRLQQEYDRLGISYQVQRKNTAILVDAYIPSELEAPLKALLEELGVKQDSNGRLLVEIRP